MIPQKQSRETRRILVFNPLKKFIGVISSQLQAARILGVKTPTIKAACDGTAISTCKLYLRWWNPEIEIDVCSELGELTLRDYDELCGVKRRVYKNKRMDRTGMKYNMKLTPEKLKRLDKKLEKELAKEKEKENESTGNQQL